MCCAAYARVPWHLMWVLLQVDVHAMLRTVPRSTSAPCMPVCDRVRCWWSCACGGGQTGEVTTALPVCLSSPFTSHGACSLFLLHFGIPSHNYCTVLYLNTGVLMVLHGAACSSAAQYTSSSTATCKLRHSLLRMLVVVVNAHLAIYAPH